ncbi:MAG TPA: DUF2975 domain-containing protein [Clostridium sp.]|nr:DUF2975 domain-containing protein [Clostridium sp.]
MKKGTTLFLKLAVILIGLPVLALCSFIIYKLFSAPVSPEYTHILYPILIGMCISAIPFYIALYMAFSLLTYIDNNKAFSQISVKALNNIKYCAASVSGIYVLLIPFVFLLADKDDAPGAILMWLIPVFASTVIAVFSAVLKRLLEKAIEIKLENDLTI